MSDWTFLTNHAHVLMVLHRDPDSRIRDIADQVGITERATHRIVHELIQTGYLEVEKVGRRNSYVVRGKRPMRHQVEKGAEVGDLLSLLDARVAS